MTNTFTDCLGREWSLKLSIPTVKAIKHATGLDIGSGDGVATYCQLPTTDRNKFAALLWEVVKAQAASTDVTEDSFLEGLDSDALQSAELAMNATFIEWQHPSVRDSVRKAIDAHHVAVKKTAEYIVAKLDSPEFNAELDRKIKEAFKPVTVAI